MNKYNLIDSVDWCDVISRNQFWIEENNVKKVVYPSEKIVDLVFYYDSNKLLRCFEKESIAYLKSNNIFNHPITMEKIPEEIFNNIDIIVKDDNITNSELALQVFQHFTKISIFIKYEKFIKLSKTDLLRLNYELSDMWINNLTDEQQKIISTNIIFKNTTELNKCTIKDIQIYLLKNIDNMLKCENNELKFMVNYIVLGALSLVIPEIKKDYPDFSFSWTE